VFSIRPGFNSIASLRKQLTFPSRRASNVFGEFMPTSRSLAIMLLLVLSILPALIGQDTQSVPDSARIHLRP